MWLERFLCLVESQDQRQPEVRVDRQHRRSFYTPWNIIGPIFLPTFLPSGHNRLITSMEGDWRKEWGEERWRVTNQEMNSVHYYNLLFFNFIWELYGCKVYNILPRRSAFTGAECLKSWGIVCKLLSLSWQTFCVNQQQTVWGKCMVKRNTNSVSRC